jgi:hypothetical protein
MKTQEEKKLVNVLPQGVTQEMIDNWKTQHGKVKLKTVFPEENEPYKTVTMVPDRKVVSEYFKWLDKDLLRANTVLIKNCVLHDKENILKDDELFFLVAKAITEDLPIGRTETKNL